MKFTVDQQACIGCGVCVSLCEKCFFIQDGLAKANDQECDLGCDADNVIESCPAGAIKKA